MKKRYGFMALLIALILTLTTLTVFGETETAAATAASADLSEYFSDRDLSGEWSAAEAVSIAFNGDGAACASSTVTVEGGTVTISAAGTYVLSGTLNDGSVVVNVGDDDKVQLVLNGVDITASDTAAIVVENADKVFVTLAEGTGNALTSAAFDEESDVDAAVFARDDITFNGTGALTIASAKHGIVGKDDVKFASGSYTIAAESRGIDANDSIRIADGSFTVSSGKDAVRCKNSEDAAKGYIVIFDGSFDLTAGGGAANGAQHSQGMMGFGRQASSASEGNSSSIKGIKASGDVTILGGAFNVDAADDAFHSDADLTVSGGTIAAASGDDGMHANDALTISGGTIAITRSYEGLEGQTILISGGDISVTADDDGLNAAGGSDQSGYGFYDMFSGSGDASLTISGGKLYVNASGDGLDSNGDLTVTGGDIVVSGPTNSGNGALDYGERGSAAITGGTLIAAGASGMAENFGSASTQVSALVNLSGQAGEIRVTDAQGNVVLSGTVDKRFDCVIVSSPDLTVGETYTVSCGSASTSVEITGTIVGSGMGMGGFGGRGGQNGGFGGRQPGSAPDGDDTQTSPYGQLPDLNLSEDGQINGQQPGDQQDNGQQPDGQQPGGFGGQRPGGRGQGGRGGH